MKTLPRLDETLDTLRRRSSLILAVMSLGFVLSAGLGTMVKPTYEAREVIQSVAPRLDGEEDTGRLRNQVDGLIRAMESNEALLAVASAYDLFADQPRTSPVAQAARLRQALDLRIEPSADPDAPLRIHVAARWNDPEQARLLAQELGHRLIRESVLLSIAEAQAAIDFTTARERELAADLADQERRISAFRTEHDAELARRDPEGMDALSRLDGEILEIDRARNALDGADAAVPLDRRRAELAAERRALLRRLAPPASLEQDYAGLLRGLAGISDQLDEAREAREAAELAHMMETRRMAERLTVVIPAEAPETPLRDPRAAIAFGGGLLTMVLAVALALFLDWRSPVVRTTRQLRRLTGAETIVSVPRADPASRRPRNGAGPL